MKKGGKALLTIGIATTMAIGTIGLTNITNMQKEENKVTIQAYNHTPANILDNVFTLNNSKYLPFVFNNTKEVITKTKITQEFTKAGLEIENISCKEEAVGTGTTITVKGSSEIYTVIVYGDVDGDGTINVFDALRIVEHIATNNKITGTAFQIAANVENGDNSLDVFDALRIVGVIAGEVDKLVVNEPEADPIIPPGPTPDEDKEKPTITIGSPVVSVKFGDNYQDNDNDVTANDNKDGDISSKVVRDKIEFIPAGGTNRENVTVINTNRIGTYTITYKVSDSSGNTETATRIIMVKGLNSIKVGNGSQEINISTLNLYITKPVDGSDEVEQDLKDHNIYTIVPIEFYDQEGTPINMIASNIQEDVSNITDGKLGINLSAGNNMIITQYYDVNGIEIEKDNSTTPVKKIGFAIALQGQANPDISQLNGKEIALKCREKEYKFPITVNYKPLQNLIMNTNTDATTLGQNKEDVYVARVNEEFTLGIVEVGELEQPITKEMIDQGIITFTNSFDTNKIDLKYELDAQGRVLLKGTIKVATQEDEDNYIIVPKVGNVEAKTTIYLRGIEVDKELSISLKDETGAVKDEFSATIDLLGEDGILADLLVNGENGEQTIYLKDIDYVQTVEDVEGNYLSISFVNEAGDELDPIKGKDEIVKQIYMLLDADSGVTAGTDVMVTITVFDGLKGIEASKTVVIHIVD